MESITSQEIEGDNDDSMKNQKFLQLKNENDRLKLIDDKFIINDINQESLNMILLFIVIELNLN